MKSSSPFIQKKPLERSQETTIQQMNELKKFGNMSARELCPRCIGTGFKHESSEKHTEKLASTKCKKCTHCIG